MRVFVFISSRRRRPSKNCRCRNRRSRSAPRGAANCARRWNRRSSRQALRTFASAKGFANYSRRYPLLIRLLRSNRLIDANTSALLDDLQNIAHAAARNLSDPTETEAVRYKTLADQLIRHFDGLGGVARLIASKTYAS